MVPQNVAEIIEKHVPLEVECIDRMYLNGYVPGPQTEGGFVHFVHQHLGFPIASTAVISPLSKAFVHAIEMFAKERQVDLVAFDKKQRKDELTQGYLAHLVYRRGAVIGKAQEKAAVFRTIHKRNTETGKSYPWISRGTALPNHYYFYLLDEDFGPLFIKFCSYFPYAVKVCINGHEWGKRQLAKEGIAFEALDNGVLSCENPLRFEAISALPEPKLMLLSYKIGAALNWTDVVRAGAAILDGMPNLPERVDNTMKAYASTSLRSTLISRKTTR